MFSRISNSESCPTRPKFKISKTMQRADPKYSKLELEFEKLDTYSRFLIKLRATLINY